MFIKILLWISFVCITLFPPVASLSECVTERNSRRQLNVIGWQRSRSDVTNSTILPPRIPVHTYSKMAATIAERSVGKNANYYTISPSAAPPPKPSNS
jgi:hypothetical protein